jgi:hypothetical protein
MRGRLKRRVALAIGLPALLAANCSMASAATGETLRMQALLNPDGSGHLFVNTPTHPRTWEVCSPALSDCAPIQSDDRYEGLNTGAIGAGVVFRVTSGDGSVGLSPLWNGMVSPLTPPSVEGSVRANERVTPRPGTWQGGWQGEGDFFQLAACRTPQGTKCTTLTDSHYPGSCPETSAVLDPAFIGDYLRVADQRRGAGPHYELRYASGSPYGARGGIWEVSAVTSVAVVGRIAAPTGPRTAKCGAPPLDEVSISSNGVARVQCGLGCHAVLIAGQAGHRARVARALARGQTTSLRLRRSSLIRLGPGRARMTLKINGRRVARRTVVLRSYVTRPSSSSSSVPSRR